MFQIETLSLDVNAVAVNQLERSMWKAMVEEQTSNKQVLAIRHTRVGWDICSVCVPVWSPYISCTDQVTFSVQSVYM